MPLFPSLNVLGNAFGGCSPFAAVQQPAAPRRSVEHLYQSWDALEDAKSKTAAIGSEVAKEYTKASNAAQAKAGAIELYSGKYYAA